MLQLVRLVTVHPALVHFTIGGLPICVLAYLAGAGRRSERFTLAGDLALFLTTAITLVVFAFGLVSNAVLDWPGGLDFWRWMHLGFGAASTGLLVILSLGRAVQLRRGVKIVRWPLALGSAFTLALVLFTGWIGGEALVFTGGMAVLGAGNGALGPTLHYAKKPPGDVMKAMGQVRGDFGQIQTFTAQMIVTAPSAKDFATVAAGARHLAFIADGMAAGAVQPPRSAEQPPGTFELVHEMHGSQTALKKMSLELAERARAVEQAAQGQDLMALVGATTALEQSCVDCHQELRWHGHGQSASR